MTKRRDLLRLLAATAPFALPRPAGAQPAPKPARIGVLWFASASDPWVAQHMAFLRQRLRELGYVEGQSILLDERHAEGNPQRLNELARELVQSKVDVIVASAVAASLAARRATETIPIVMLHAGNPVDAGLIASLARPGGNVTGTTNLLLGGKLVEMMRELLPRARRLAVLVNPTNAAFREGMAVAAEATRAFNIALVLAENRLPAIYGEREMVEAGGLMSYWTDWNALRRHAAEFVDRILKGAKPADLPVEDPIRFELVVNLKTARALGLTIPLSTLLSADEVIQ